MPIVKHQAIDSSSHGLGRPRPQHGKVWVWYPRRLRKGGVVRILRIGFG